LYAGILASSGFKDTFSGAGSAYRIAVCSVIAESGIAGMVVSIISVTVLTGMMVVMAAVFSMAVVMLVVFVTVVIITVVPAMPVICVDPFFHVRVDICARSTVRVAGPAVGSIIPVTVNIVCVGDGIAAGDAEAEAAVSLAGGAQRQAREAKKQCRNDACDRVHNVVLKVS